MSIEVSRPTPIANTIQVANEDLIRSLVLFFEHERFGIVSANLPDAQYIKPAVVDSFLPDVVATITRDCKTVTVYGVALGCQSIENSDIVRAIQILAGRTQVYVITHETCGGRMRELKQTIYAHNNISILSV